MSFIGDKKRVECMLKNNSTAFLDAENMLFGPKYEELVAKSLSSKNRSKELFGSIKTQGSSKEGKRRQPFQKSPLFRTRENRGRGMFTAADQILQQKHLQEDKEWVNSIFHQLDGPSVCIKILQNTVVNLCPVSIQQLSKAGRVKHFVKNWQNLTNNPMILDIIRGYKIPLFCHQGNQSYQSGVS